MLGLVADIATTLLIRTNPNVTDARIVADVGFERFQLHDPGTPSRVGGGQIVVESLQMMIEVATAAQACDGLFEEVFEAIQIFVDFGEFSAGVTEEVLDVVRLTLLLQIDSQKPHCPFPPDRPRMWRVDFTVTVSTVLSRVFDVHVLSLVSKDVRSGSRRGICSPVARSTQVLARCR